MKEERKACYNCKYSETLASKEPCLSCGPSLSNFEPKETTTAGTNTEESNVDMVNHPPHYQTKSGLETIQVIEAFTEGLDGIEAVCTANVIKYICRWKKKNGLQDLKKAQWYLTHLIEHVEKNWITVNSDGLYMNGVDLLKAAEEAIQGHVEVTNLYATKSLEEIEKESK